MRCGEVRGTRRGEVSHVRPMDGPCAPTWSVPKSIQWKEQSKTNVSSSFPVSGSGSGCSGSGNCCCCCFFDSDFDFDLALAVRNTRSLSRSTTYGAFRVVRALQ